MKPGSHRSVPVMRPAVEQVPRVDFADGFDPGLLNNGWGIGGYNTMRQRMYTAPQYKNQRNIHMGVDIWAPAGEPVYAPVDGIVAYTAYHEQEGNYGGTVVLKHTLNPNQVFALYGHLSLQSVKRNKIGSTVEAGQVIGWLGNEHENGHWHPHLHYQLSVEDPGEADMPGVVSQPHREQSLKLYPDPEVVIGSLV